MMTAEIPGFLDVVRRRLDRDVRIRAASWCLLAAATACVVWALGWRVFGYAAPRPVYGFIIGVTLISGVAWVAWKRRNVRDAAHVADKTFELKDGLISWLDFKDASCAGEVYDLNERELSKHLETLDASRVVVRVPGRMLGVGVLLAAIGIFLAILPHGAAVRDRLAREALALQRGAEVEKQVNEALEEIIKSLSEEEKRELDPAALRKWAKELQATKDGRENEKQLARLEQEISKAMLGLEARQDEAVMKLAAEELSKSSMADARKLGKQLEAKDFEKAAMQMNDLKPLAKEKMTPEELEKLRRNAEKAKEMAKRMADGARRKDFGKPRDSNDKRQAGEAGKDMGEMLEEMDENARDLAKELEEMEEGDEPAEEMLAEAAQLDENADELGKRMGRLGARQKAKNKLDALRRGLGAARQFGQGKTSQLGLAQSMSQSNQPGGLKPGTGSDSSRREQRDEFKDNGNMAELRGQQNNNGSSQKSVETADSGTGIAGKANVAKERQFRQQLESLVHRDDIPESLKLGVREYFETVHETEQPDP